MAEPIRMFVEVRMNLCVMADVVRDDAGDLVVKSVCWTQDPSPTEVMEALYNGDPRDVENLEKRYDELLKNKGDVK